MKKKCYLNFFLGFRNTRLIYDLNDNQDKTKNKKSLLIDSPRYIFDQFYYHYLSTISILADNKLFRKSRVLITENEFMIDCLNVLISLPSNSFFWIEVFNLS